MCETEKLAGPALQFGLPKEMTLTPSKAHVPIAIAVAAGPSIRAVGIQAVVVVEFVENLLGDGGPGAADAMAMDVARVVS